MTVIGAGFRTGSYTCNRCRFLLGFKIDTFEMYTSQNKKARHRAHPPRITELPNQSQTMNINHNPQSNNIHHRHHRTTNIEEHSSIHLSLKFFTAAHHRHRRREGRRWREGAAARGSTACPPSRSGGRGDDGGGGAPPHPTLSPDLVKGRAPQPGRRRLRRIHPTGAATLPASEKRRGGDSEERE